MAKGATKKGGKKVTKKTGVKKNPLFESTPRNFRVGGAIQHERDMTRFVRWPKYVLLQRQKRILLRRLKVPPQIHQFTHTLPKDQAKGLFKLLQKYAPETKTEKKARLLNQADQKAQKAAPKDGKKPLWTKFGLNHVTTLVENKQAKLVVIAHDVDPIELVVWLPTLCRKQNIPFCIVKGKERLGKLVHQKQAAVVCLTEVRKEDESELALFAKNCLEQFNQNESDRKHWGGNQLGIKSQHAEEIKQKALEKEQLKKAGL